MALSSIIKDMLQKKYINDELWFLRSEQEAEMKHDDEKPPTFLLYSDCFAPLLRVGRTDWKPLYFYFVCQGSAAYDWDENIYK